MARKKEKRDNRNTRSLPAYRRVIIDKLGRQGIFLDFKYDGSARNSFGVFRRRTEYPFKSESVQRDAAGRPVYDSNMGHTPEEICEAADALEGIMRAERSNAKLCVNAILRLPFDAPLKLQLEITRRYCREVFGAYDLPYVAVLHKPDPDGDQRNFHVHITFAFRQMVRIGDHKWAIGADLRTDLDTTEQFSDYRRIAAEIMTKVMRKAGHNRTYTHLSNAARGLPIVPEKDLDKAQVNQVRRGSYVGANAFNAREIASGERALERLIVECIPPLKTVETVGRMTPMNPPGRRVSIAPLTIAKPNKCLGLRPLMKRIRLAGMGAVNQLVERRLLAAKTSASIIPALVLTKPSGTPPPLVVLSILPVTLEPKLAREVTGVICASARATNKTAFPISTNEPARRAAIVAAPSTARFYLLARPSRDISSRSQPRLLIRIGRVSVARCLVLEPRLATSPPEYALPMLRRALAIPYSSTSVLQRRRQVIFGRSDLITQVTPQRIRDAVTMKVDRSSGRVQKIAPPSCVKNIWPLVTQPYSCQRPMFMPSVGVSISRNLLSRVANPGLVLPIVTATPVCTVTMVRARTCHLKTCQHRPRASAPRIAKIDIRRPKLVPRLDTHRTHVLEQALILPTVSRGVVLLSVSSSNCPIAKAKALPISVVHLVRPPKMDNRMRPLAPPAQLMPLHSLPLRPCKVVHSMPAAPPQLAPAIFAVRPSKMLLTSKLEMPAHTTAGFAQNLDRIRSTRKQVGELIETIAPRVGAVPDNGTRMSLLKENWAVHLGKEKASTTGSARAVHQSVPSQRMTKEEIRDLLKPRRVGPDGIFHVVDKPVGEPMEETGASQIGVTAGRPISNRSSDLDKPSSDNGGRAPASFAHLGRPTTDATAAPPSDAHDLLVNRFEMARSDDERRISAPAIRADKIAFERMTQRNNAQWNMIDREFRDEQRNAADKGKEIRE